VQLIGNSGVMIVITQVLYRFIWLRKVSIYRCPIKQVPRQQLLSVHNLSGWLRNALVYLGKQFLQPARQKLVGAQLPILAYLMPVGLK
jgi:hypothetical protein